MKRKAADAGVSLDAPANLDLLDEEEIGLVKLAAQYPRTVEAGAMAHEPHRIAFYLYDWRLRSTRYGIAATTIRIVASSLKITQNFLARGWNSR